MSDKSNYKPAGCVVRVTTQQMSGGEPMTALYAAAIFMPSEAEEAVRKRDGSTPDEEVDTVDTLSQATLDGLGLKKGEIRAFT